jgi:tetratricopeptide (TPR) repeat protein
MPLESYKKWSIAAIFAVISAVLILSLMEPPDYREEKTGLPSAPLLETGKMPDDPKSLSVIGDKYFEGGRFEKAIEVYEKVLELDPNDVDTYNDLGLAYHYTGKSDIAIEKLKKGTEVMPSYQRVWLSLGFVLVSTGITEDAKPVLKKAVELDPDSTVGLEAKRMLDLL